MIAALSFASTIATAQVPGTALSQRDDRVILEIDSPRPVASAVWAVAKQYGVRISYEDPRYLYKGDLKDWTNEVRRDIDQYPPGQAPKIIGPYAHQLTIVADVAGVARDSEPVTLLRRILDAQAASEIAGRFRIRQSKGMYHVEPTSTRGPQGDWIPNPSVLDTPITLTLQERTAPETIEAICRAIGQAAHVDFRMGMGLEATGNWQPGQRPPLYEMSASNEPARDVLLRALDSFQGLARPLTWVLYYSPQTKVDRYRLNLLQVPDGTDQRNEPPRS